jgi:methylenetetrahydrofolate dehydrogenase (NADP+)/methenyltetrahydrofolate cyclohydrolase
MNIARDTGTSPGTVVPDARHDVQIIDGKKIAEALRARLATGVAKLASQAIKPGLAVVLVGDDAASQVYVRNKIRQTTEVGMNSFHYELPVATSESDVLALLCNLNKAAEVDGILVQLPLPPHIDAHRIIEAIDPAKDVDGFHAVNAGRLMNGTQGFVPCTPLGSLLLLRSVCPDLSGLDAVVVGRSNIVGKPMAQLLMRENCTVTVAHSRTRDLARVCARADILVAAVGRAEMIRGDWIKPGAIVIDVGINRMVSEGRRRLVGDVAFDEASKVAGAITPVPGGVGPMTIACLLRNTLEAACLRRGMSPASFIED